MSLAEQYKVALESHLRGEGGEGALNAAYELGRKAYVDGLGVLEMAKVHHAALSHLVESRALALDRPHLERASEFFAESISPFEMSFRVHLDTNAKLAALNETLRLANDKLVAEIADRLRAETALRQAQKLQAIGRLAGGVAHNFNNLLTVVLGNLDAARDRAANDETLGQALATAARAAERGAKVTKQLLAFSRQQMLRPEVIEPAKRLRDIASLLGATLRGDLAIETEIGADLSTVEIDQLEFELAFLNLGFNARDAMPKGGVLRISAANRTMRDDRLALDGDYLVISVADTGQGIRPELLPRVFEPFFTTKDVGAGSGLGLSQVYGFANQSGGAVDIESRVGGGTTVHLYLPARRAQPTAEGAVEHLQPHEHRAAGTVLVVDDDVDVANLAAQLLTRCGFKVKLAYRAHAALDLLRKGEGVDLIFSDILMPDGMNGIQLAEEVKRRYPELPVLLATGYRDAATDAGARGLQIIAKPYRARELCASVTALLGESGA
jgi:signal transduction histidine kinase